MAKRTSDHYVKPNERVFCPTVMIKHLDPPECRNCQNRPCVEHGIRQMANVDMDRIEKDSPDGMSAG